MNFTEKTISSECVFEGKILKVYSDKVILPNGKTASREVCRHSGAVAIVPVTEKGEVILVRQFRYPYSEHLIEIPAGKIDPGEDPDTAARRELSEEISRSCDELIPIGEMYPAPGAQYEPVYLYIAKGLSECNGTPDEDEFVEAVTIDENILVDRILSGEIKDAKTCVAVLKYHTMKNRA